MTWDEIADDQGLEVEAVLDVYITHALADSLFQLQFPTKIHKTSIDLSMGRIKPASNLIQLEFPINEIRDNVYDIDKITFQSTHHPNSATYMVGVVVDNALHLTPIHSTLQLTPELSYYDKLHEKPVEEKTEQSYADQPVQLTMKRKDESKDESIQAKFRKQRLEEPWSLLHVFNPNSIESQDVCQSLYSSTEDIIECLSKPLEYLDLFGPKIHASSGHELKSGRLLSDMHKLPLAQMVANLMINANVLPFAEIRAVVLEKHTSPEITIQLGDCAVLVRGVWILKTKLKYASPSRAFDARQYLLYLFQKDEIVKRADFNKVAKLLPEMCQNMMEEISYLIHGVGWKLKWEPDLQFCGLYPQVVEMQLEAVEIIGKKAMEWMIGKTALKVHQTKISSGSTGSRSEIPKSAIAASNSKKDAMNHAAIPVNVSGISVRDQCKDLVCTLCKFYGVVSFDLVCNQVAARCKTNVPGNLLFEYSVNPNFINSILEECCIALHNRFVLRKLDNQDIDEVRIRYLTLQYRKHVVNLYKGKPEWKKAEIMNACEIGTKKKCPQIIYQKIMKELAYSRGPVWCLKEVNSSGGLK